MSTAAAVEVTPWRRAPGSPWRWRRWPGGAACECCGGVASVVWRLDFMYASRTRSTRLWPVCTRCRDRLSDPGSPQITAAIP
jgi:hypothetical protein